MNVYFRFPAQAKECFLAGATSPSDVSDICSRITYANEEDIHSLMSGFVESGLCSILIVAQFGTFPFMVTS